MSIESVLITETLQLVVVLIAGGAGEKHKIKFNKLCSCTTFKRVPGVVLL